jgi:hypothetical protein
VGGFRIPKTQPPRKQQKLEVLQQLKSVIQGCKILQDSKQVEKVGEHDAIDKEGSFIRPYLADDWYVYDEHGAKVSEPRAPLDVPLLEEDFKGQPDHPPQWWGVRLTEHDQREGGYERSLRGMNSRGYPSSSSYGW